MLTYIGQSNLCRSKVVFPLLRSLATLKHIILKFPLPPASLDPTRGVCKAGKKNIVSKHEIYRVEITSVQSLHNELRLHGPMHILRYLGHC